MALNTVHYERAGSNKAKMQGNEHVGHEGKLDEG